MSGAAVQEDPLDAFMATIEQEIVQQRKQEQQPTAVDVDDIIADSNTRGEDHGSHEHSTAAHYCSALPHFTRTRSSS